MKKFLLISCALVLAASPSFAVITLNFNSLSGTTIQFNGNDSTFQLNPISGSAATPQFEITSQTGGSGLAVGLVGWVNNGPWAYGAISTFGPVEFATVTGPLGSLFINDATSVPLTGTIDWAQVSTFGSAGSINAFLSVNVSDLAYAGANQDLLDLVAGTGDGAINLSFQFNPGKTLTQLSTGESAFTTSYSGSLAPVVPEAGTWIAGALLLLPFAATTLRFIRTRKNAA